MICPYRGLNLQDRNYKHKKMSLEKLKAQVQGFPQRPGVYLMKNARGQMLYVGKATQLRSRVLSYFSKEAHSRYQIRFLMSKVQRIETMVTDNAKEALLLENTLIKKHYPRYNIHLKDDKSYVSLKLTVGHPVPRLEVTRRIRRDGSLYFGPYTSAGACREVVDFIQRHFRLRTCTDHEFKNRVRPCLQYQIKLCDAPCVGLVSREEYQDMVQQVEWFLRGKSQELRKTAERKMHEASRAEQFEEAARYRDLLQDMEETLEKQKMVTHQGDSRDVLGLARQGESVTCYLMKVREGRVSGHSTYFFESMESEEELAVSFLNQYYENAHDGEAKIPPEVLVSFSSEDLNPLQEILSERRGGSVKLYCPQRGEKAKLKDLAMANAEQALRLRLQQDDQSAEILQSLEKKLQLKNLPTRIECYDISHFQGGQTVGSMVTFVQGKAQRNLYRRFQVKSVRGPDDFASLYEVLYRRLKRGLEAKLNDRENPWALPELMVIDGGKGQLNAALQAAKDLGVTGVDFIALAKSRLSGDGGKPQSLEDKVRSAERVFLPGRKNPVILKPNSNELFLLMQLRDEAHRFGIEAHRKRQKKHSLASQMEQIPGLGPKRRQKLLQTFGSWAQIKEASIEDVAIALGGLQNLARRVKKVQ